MQIRFKTIQNGAFKMMQRSANAVAFTNTAPQGQTMHVSSQLEVAMLRDGYSIFYTYNTAHITLICKYILLLICKCIYIYYALFADVQLLSLFKT